jgi:hypothetical protein
VDVKVIFTPSGETVGRGTLKTLAPLGHRFDPLTMKMLPCATFEVLLAESHTAVIVGTGGPPLPPVLIVPAPEKLTVTVLPAKAPVPFRLGKDPVAPAKFPVPWVIVAAPVPVPDTRFAVPVRFPVSVPVVPVVSVMTNVPVEVSRSACTVIVPVPTFERVTKPLRVPVAPLTGPLAVPVITVLMVAACPQTHASIISVGIASVQIIRKSAFTLWFQDRYPWQRDYTSTARLAGGVIQ